MRTLHEKLKTGKPVLGCCVMYPSPGVVERIGPDWDWLWIDGQHGQHDYRSLLQCVRAADYVQRDSVVRVPGHEAGFIGLVMDTAASGVMVPLVSTPEEARAVASAVKFPPIGSRSYGGRRPIDLYGRAYSDTANEDVLLVAQIETPEAIENAEEIAAVPGVDVLFVGPDDVAIRLGMPMSKPRPKGIFDKEMQHVAEAAKKHGKFAGTVCRDPEAIKDLVALGYQLLVSGGDVPFLADSSKRASEEMRNALAG